MQSNAVMLPCSRASAANPVAAGSFDDAGSMTWAVNLKLMTAGMARPTTFDRCHVWCLQTTPRTHVTGQTLQRRLRRRPPSSSVRIYSCNLADTLVVPQKRGIPCSVGMCIWGISSRARSTRSSQRLSLLNAYINCHPHSAGASSAAGLLPLPGDADLTVAVIKPHAVAAGVAGGLLNTQSMQHLCSYHSPC